MLWKIDNSLEKIRVQCIFTEEGRNVSLWMWNQKSGPERKRSFLRALEQVIQLPWMLVSWSTKWKIMPTSQGYDEQVN